MIVRLNETDLSGTWREEVLESESAGAVGAMSSENVPAMEAELASLRREVERLRTQLQPTVRAADTRLEMDLRPTRSIKD